VTSHRSSHVWFFVAALAGVLSCGCGLRHGDDVIIPSDFEGWVRIYYEVADAPGLPIENGRFQIRVPLSGVVRTSNSRSPGYGADRYFLMGQDGSKVLVERVDDRCPSEKCVSGFQFYSSPKKLTIFFVGSALRMRLYPKPSSEQLFSESN